MVYTWMTRALLFTGVLASTIVATGCHSSRATEARISGPTKNRVRLEHVALNVADPVAVAKWYADNLGMKIMREGPAPVNMRFLADPGGNMMLELYHNPPDAVPDYASMNPLVLHVAFTVDDVDAIRARLLAAGATPTDEVTVTPAGDRLTILRDPWGLAIQFIRRANPMLPQE